MSRSCCSLQLPVRETWSVRSILQVASDRAQAPDPAAVLEVTEPVAWAEPAGLEAAVVAVLVVLVGLAVLVPVRELEVAAEPLPDSAIGMKLKRSPAGQGQTSRSQAVVSPGVSFPPSSLTRMQKMVDCEGGLLQSAKWNVLSRL